jgi:hypothetical protein
MGIDENHISLRPGGGIKGPVKTGNLPSFRSAPLQSSNRPLNSYRRPPIPLQSSHRPTVSLQTSHQRSEPLQSSSQALSRNSQSIIAESSIAGVDLQAQVQCYSFFFSKPQLNGFKIVSERLNIFAGNARS